MCQGGLNRLAPNKFDLDYVGGGDYFAGDPTFRVFGNAKKEEK